MAKNGEEFDVVYKKSIEKIMKHHIHLIPLATETFLCILSNWTSQNVNSQRLCRAYNVASCDLQISGFQNLSLASDITSDTVEIHIGHLSSCIGHFTYQMISNCHCTLDICVWHPQQLRKTFRMKHLTFFYFFLFSYNFTYIGIVFFQLF